MTNKPTLTLLVGPPGSGKSVLAQTYRCHGYPAIRISQDDQGKEGHFSLFLKSIADGQCVTIDRMNFSREQRARYLDVARANGYETRIIVLQVPKAVCMERMITRKDHPTITNQKEAGSALNTFFSKYERPTAGEADVIEFRGHEGERPECVVIDLDGTMCNTDHRQKFVDQKPKDWKSFFAGISNDSVNRWCLRLAIAMAREGKEIIFASGRPDDYREKTLAWLGTNVNIWGSQLFMRPRGDFRRDDVVKEIILDFEILPRYRPLFAVDDRQQVVDLWRRRGITCLQCAPGDF